MELVESLASQLARAADDIAGYLDGAKVGLCKTVINLDNGVPPLATFTAALADYTGYAAEVITWSTPSVGDDGTVEVIGTVGEFRPSAPSTGKTVATLYITEGTPANALFAGILDGQPLEMAATTDQLTVMIRYKPGTKSICVVVS